MKGCHFLLAVASALLSGASVTAAQTFESYRPRDEISDTPAAQLLQNESCHVLPHPSTLELDDAILQAICAHPRARRAWLEARARAAALGIIDATYLPTLTWTAQFQSESQSGAHDINGHRSLSTSHNVPSAHTMLNMSWVLFDFGTRGAKRRQARALIAAANAIQNSTLQAVLFHAAEAFYAVRDAQASVDAARHTEAIARTILSQATAKHAAGAGTRSDELQARTSYRRAELDRVDAEGNVLSAMGTLAVALGLDANTKVRVATEDDDTDIDTSDYTDADIDQLIADAKQHQPKLAAARAKLDASRADIDIARSQGRPTLSLVGSLAQNHSSRSKLQPAGPSSSRGGTIGAQLTIPLFDGFASRYEIERAEAHADAQEAALRDAELQVSLDVWRSYQAVRTDTANLANSRHLLDDAKQALSMAQGRYNEGVGTFTELLTAQAALTDARKLRVLAISKWRTARLRLAASLGKLGLWAATP